VKRECPLCGQQIPEGDGYLEAVMGMRMSTAALTQFVRLGGAPSDPVEGQKMAEVLDTIVAAADRLVTDLHEEAHGGRPADRAKIIELTLDRAVIVKRVVKALGAQWDAV
jgi:hypothetical protein